MYFQECHGSKHLRDVVGATGTRLRLAGAHFVVLAWRPGYARGNGERGAAHRQGTEPRTREARGRRRETLGRPVVQYTATMVVRIPSQYHSASAMPRGAPQKIITIN